MKSLAVLALLLTACGGDDTVAKMDSGMGSGSGSGSGANKVTTVTCSGTPKVVMTVDGTNSYMPMSTTISAGSMVEFKTSIMHNVVPNTLLPTDPGLTVGFNADVCLKFSTAGTYNFNCSVHGFKGSIVVN